MSKSLCCIVLCATMNIVFSAGDIVAQEPRVPASNTEIASAASVGEAVNRALDKALETGLSGLTMKKAVLKLETGSAVSGGIELNFLIFTISHKTKKGSTQGTELVFEKQHNAGAGTLKTQDLVDPLAKAIATAAETAKQINALPIASATISMDFAVEKSTGGKISFKLFGSTESGNIDVTTTSKNNLTVTFSQ